MTLQDLISLLANKLATLNNAKSTAVVGGDIAAVVRLDSEILETQTTLQQLQGVQ